MRVLVAGWFSFRHGEATAGDLLAMQVAVDWLEEAGIAHDVACSPVLGGGVDLETIDPSPYTDVVFVCGPAAGQQVDDLRQQFSHCRLTLLDVSLTGGGDGLADRVLERDSDRLARPDLAIATPVRPVPFVAVVRGHAQPEYGPRDGHEKAVEAIDALLERQRLAVAAVDTRVAPELPEAREPSQIEGVLSRADAVVTSRMHGLVLALKHGVPALAIDPVHGGAKVSAQARALDWPEVLTLEEATPEAVDAALARCLEPSARAAAQRCRQRAIEEIRALGEEFLAGLTGARAGAPD